MSATNIIYNGTKNDTANEIVKLNSIAASFHSARNWFNSRNFIFYTFYEIGIRYNSLNAQSKLKSGGIASRNLLADQVRESGSPKIALPLYFGFGFKKLVYSNWGISAELGLLPGIINIGTFYSYIHKARRNNNQYGW